MSLCRFCSSREGVKVSPANACSLCGGLFDQIEGLSKEILEKLSEYQYDSLLIGTAMPQKILDNEDELRARLRIRGKESIKSHFNSVLTRRMVSLTGKMVDYSLPDVTVIVSLTNDSISVISRSIWLSARYKKLRRGIPQRSSICPVCNGLGCAECAYNGKSGKSVETLVSALFCKKFRAESCSFVWLGSEDENSLVGGSGRPFFVELIQPRRRFSRFSVSGRQKSALESEGLQITKIHRLERKFSAVPMFEISCRVFLKRDEGANVSEFRREEIENSFSKRTLNVRLNRRYRVVQRLVRSISAIENVDGTAELAIKCEGGIPIKKFVTGQDDTVEPNLSSLVKSYHIDPERPFDILDVFLSKSQTRGTSGSQHFGDSGEDLSDPNQDGIV